MGLDMYLTAERYFWTYPEDGPDALVAKSIAALVPELAVDDTVKTVSVEAGYWRKANQIHNWFVKNVQDGVDECEPHEVSYEQLIQLRDACQKVLDDNTLADSLLPTGAGFFFGGTDYDEYYFSDLKDTIKVIDATLEKFFTEKLDDGTVYSKWEVKYQSSW